MNKCTCFDKKTKEYSYDMYCKVHGEFAEEELGYEEGKELDTLEGLDGW